MLQVVQEGDYEGLVKIMGYLMNIKERGEVANDMFGPLTDIIELLKFYDMDIPEEVNVLLQELPEQWVNTKKNALTVKQQVAPLQASEVTLIRKKILEFDGDVQLYRDFFKALPIFKYDCSKPYKLFDHTSKDLDQMEKVMSSLQCSGSLFEVTVPEFKLLKQCRKELRMIKVVIFLASLI